MVLRITALCVAVAMICAALRMQRPELATAVSLAGGVAALAMALSDVAPVAQWQEAFRRLLGQDGDVAALVLKGAGIAVVSELGTQLCADAGERALAGRIALAARLATLGLCASMLSCIAGLVGEGLVCGD